MTSRANYAIIASALCSLLMVSPATGDGFGDMTTRELELLLRTYQTSEWQEGLELSSLEKLNGDPIPLLPVVPSERIEGSEASVQIRSDGQPGDLAETLDCIEKSLLMREDDLYASAGGPVVAMQEWPTKNSLWYLVSAFADVEVHANHPAVQEHWKYLRQSRNCARNYLAEDKSHHALLLYLHASTKVESSADMQLTEFSDMMFDIKLANRLPMMLPFQLPRGSVDEIEVLKTESANGKERLVELSTRRFYDQLRLGVFDSNPRYHARRQFKRLLADLLRYALHQPESFDADRHETETLIHRLFQSDDAKLVSHSFGMSVDMSRALQRAGYPPLDIPEISELIEELRGVEHSYALEVKDLGVVELLDQISRKSGQQ